MKLYYTKGACSLAVRIIINEIGLKAEYESVDLKSKRTEKNDDYLKINPKGSVPVLKLDNGDVLTENAVILQYLADTSHANQLLPPINDFKRYRVLEWLNYVTTELHKSFGLLFSPVFNDEMKEQVIKLIHNKFSYVDKHLATHDYLCEGSFTLPDGYLFVILNWSVSYFKFDLKKWPNLDRYYTTLKQRASIKASLTQEKLLETMQ